MGVGGDRDKKRALERENEDDFRKGVSKRKTEGRKERKRERGTRSG